jgi:arginyl-tRNA synthetase
MFEEFERQVKDVIRRTLKEEDITAEPSLEEPVEDFGDLSTPICFELASVLKKPPSSIAEELVEKMEAGGLIRKIKAEKGYINFYLNYEKLAPMLLREIKEKKGDYGRGRGKERVVLEHTSANPDGPLHIGHARNGIIGDTLSRIMKFAGYAVESQYYINDMGKQLAVVVWGLRRFQLDEKKKKDHAIADIYVKARKELEKDPSFEEEISQLMKAYEAGADDIRGEFEKAVNYCLEGIAQTLERINIHHDSFIWESSFLRDSSVKKAIDKLERSKYARRDGALSLDLSEFGIEKELVLTRADGTSLYPARDIAYHLWKAGRGTVIDIFGSDHKLVSRQLSAALSILGEKRPEFIIYEFISLPEGKMSTRKGVFISLDELLDESVKRAYEEVDKRRPDLNAKSKSRIAESVGVGAVRFNIVKVSPEKSLIFRWEEALDFERQGAPFVQYAYARACRILEKADVPESFHVGDLTEHERRLIKALSRFPSIVREAADSRRPHIVAAYALELANCFHRFYMFDTVLKSEKEVLRRCKFLS